MRYERNRIGSNRLNDGAITRVTFHTFELVLVVGVSAENIIVPKTFKINARAANSNDHTNNKCDDSHHLR